MVSFKLSCVRQAEIQFDRRIFKENETVQIKWEGHVEIEKFVKDKRKGS